jgi:DNA polymerase-1
MILKIVVDLEPTYMVVCFDRPEPTFRHEEYEEYQAHRPEKHEDLISQFKKSKDVVRAMNLILYERSGFEADDIIGTIVKKASKKKVKTIVVTGDKDILQLVGGNTYVYLPVRGLSNAQMMGKKEVVEKLSIGPSQIVDYKALIGDQSDNYPGVKGIGPKTAVDLLSKYKTLSGIYKNIQKIEKKGVKEKLVEDKENAYLSRKLAVIEQNVPIKFDLENTSNWSVDNEKIMMLFSEYGFRTLSKRAKEVGKKIIDEKQMTLV